MSKRSFYLSDLDYTLLRSDQSVGAYTKDVWNRCVQKGLRLSIATARSFTGVMKLLEGLTLKEPMILLDGVMIARRDGEILHLSAIDRELGDAIIEEAGKAFETYPLLVALEEGSNTERFIYPKVLSDCQKRLMQTFHNDRRMTGVSDFRAYSQNLKLVYLGDETTMRELEAKLLSEFGAKIETKLSEDPYIHCWFLTVLHREGDKAHALKRLEEIEGVDAAHTTVFGDSHNDLGLFDAAGRKIAMKNAIDELKAKADIVLPWSNDEEGVAKFLAEEILNEKTTG